MPGGRARQASIGGVIYLVWQDPQRLRHRLGLDLRTVVYPSNPNESPIRHAEVPMAVATFRTLTQAQVDQFMRDGFVVVENLLDGDEIATLAERADLIASGKAEHIVKGIVQLEKPFREGEAPVEDQVLSTRKLAHIVPEDEVLRAHARNPKVVDVIADLYRRRRHHALRRPALYEAAAPRVRPDMAPGLSVVQEHLPDGHHLGVDGH